MFPIPPLAQYKEVTFFDTGSDTPKTIDLTGQMAARGNTIDYTTLSFFNYDDELFTDNNAGVATITTTAVGTYLTNYKFDAAVPGSNCADNILTSNDGKIKVKVVPNCNFAFDVVENPYPTPTPTLTPTSTLTPTPTSSPTPTPSQTIPGSTPNPTNTLTPTPSPSPSHTPTPTLTPSPTSTPTPTPSATVNSRAILLSNPPGETTSGAACAITTGLTKFISGTWAITNGLVIYNDPTLTAKTYTSDPYSGNYAMLYDTNNSLRYAVTFDSSGNVNTVISC
jgi:hypothetical protein